MGRSVITLGDLAIGNPIRNLVINNLSIGMLLYTCAAQLVRFGGMTNAVYANMFCFFRLY